MEYKLHSLGAIRETIDVRDYRGKTELTEFPRSFALSMPAVKDQGTVCSCVAHALASTIEYLCYQEIGSYYTMSTDYIYGNRRGSLWKEDGMRIRDALKACCTYGDVSYEEMPGNTEVPEVIDLFESVAEQLLPSGRVNGIRRYFRLDDANAIKSCLLNYGPVLFSIPWYDDNYVRDGILHVTGTKEKENGSHCMVIYGWNENGWKIQNSWGTRWANQGRAILPFDTQIDEAWGVEDKYNDEEAEDIKIVVPFTGSIGKIIAEFLNWLLNLLRRKNDN